MPFRHVVSHLYRRARRRYPFSRYISPTTAIIILIWYYTLYWGERATFSSHIAACHWDKWERWAKDASPHHMVLVADPQLVDPHTYPGRPWPLNSLTEIYTDMYMARNFRLINANLDPDAVVFLGDLFDGGREWSTNRAKPFKKSSKKEEDSKSGQKEKRSRDQEIQDDKLAEDGEQEGNGLEKRSVESYHYALEQPHSDPISKTEHNIAKDGKTDLRGFVYGEDGRWAKWGTTQWDTEYERFGRIFLSPRQLYPLADRDLLPVSDANQHPIAIENGATESSWQEYAVIGRQRQVWTSLPGNHDIGFGNQVQWTVRDRFETYFGETNGLRVIGNHTFVAVDTPSYSAFQQWLLEGGETTDEMRMDTQHLWTPTREFLAELNQTATKAVAEVLHNYYPGGPTGTAALHVVANTDDADIETPITKASQIPVDGQTRLPVILLSHIPLFRNPEVDCGPQRERGHSISISAGYQYQNVLHPWLTTDVVQQTAVAGEIRHVFSGDDHDYCDVTHNFNFKHGSDNVGKDSFLMKSIKEITVKSFSWAMGVRLPGFLLVTLWNPIDERGQTIGTSTSSIQTHLCILPDQLITFIAYGKLLVVTFFVLFVRAIVLAVRHKPEMDRDSSSEDESPTELMLPRFKRKSNDQKSTDSNGVFGKLRKGGEKSKHRHRTSSISTSTSNITNNNNLSVQRNYYARTRSVSPAAGIITPVNNYTPPNSFMPNLQDTSSGPLIDKAGYYPQFRWEHPDESDEESHVGDDHQDSQAKWKKRKRPRSRFMRFVVEFFASLAIVAVPSGLYYGVLIRNG